MLFEALNPKFLHNKSWFGKIMFDVGLLYVNPCCMELVA